MRKKWKKAVACVLTGAFVLNNIPWSAIAAKAENAAGSNSMYLIQAASASNAAETVASPSNALAARAAAETGETYVYEAEKYYSGDIQTDGDVTFCDMQPGNTITIPVDDQGLVGGNYELMLRSNGNRTGYRIYVNGTFTGVLKREASGWNAADLTEDTYGGVLALKAGDEITIEAPNDKYDGDGQGYGKLDSMTLYATDAEPENPGVLEEIVFRSEDWYCGTEDGNGGVNLRQNDQIDYAIRTEDGFSEDGAEYYLSVQIGGGRTEYTVKVNGTEAGTIVRNATDWGVLEPAGLEGTVSLKAGDVLSICAGSDNYGTVENVTLTKVEEQASEYIFEAEEYYSGDIQTDGDVTFCDMQPGNTITIPVDDQGLVGGNYELMLRSNGTRMGYRIYVNGTFTGVLKRGASGWNAADLTEDTYGGVLALKAGDEITIEATKNKDEGDNPGYGKLDSMTLFPTDAEPENPGVLEEIVLRSEDWYCGTEDGSGGVNLRPDDQIDYAIRTEDGFSEAGAEYTLSARIGGFRTEYTVKVNGTEAGTIFRDATDWGVLEPAGLEGTVSLKAGDVLSICAGSGSYGTVAEVTLTAKAEEPGNDYQETDNSTGVEASAEAGVVPEGVSLVVSEVMPGTPALDAACADNGIDVSKGTYFDIWLENENGEKVQPENGRVKLAIPLPEGYKDDAIAVFHLSDDGAFNWITDYRISGEDTKMVEFYVTSFSIFGIVDKSENVVIPEPDTSYVYEAEDYYSGDIQTDGDVTFCDMQPGETIKIPVSDKELESGNYRLSVSSNGTRTGYRIYVNGVPAGIVKRETTGWGAADLTVDFYDGILSLEPGDIITVEAPKDKDGNDNQLYGKLDSITLEPVDETPEIPGLLEQVVLGSADWYFGSSAGDQYVNLRPDDQIDYFIREEEGFGAEESVYELTLETGGFDREYIIKVNGTERGSVWHSNTSGDDWSNYGIQTLERKLSLKAGDVLSVYAVSNYGMVGNLTLKKTEEEPEKDYEKTDSATNITVTALAGVVPENSTLEVKMLTAGSGNQELAAALKELKIDDSQGTFYDIQLKDENGSKVNPDGTVTIEIPVPDGYDESKISVFRIQDGKPEWVENARVENGKIIINVTGFGIVGIVEDYVETGVYAYEAENYYTGNIESDGDVTYIDMQPGDTIKIPVSDQPMEAGNYKLTLRSNGDRNGYRIYVNGKPAGIVNRRGQSVGWGAADLTEDAYDGVLSLKPGDVITIEAPTNTVEKGDDNGPLYGKLDSMILRLTDEEPENPGLMETVVLKSEDWYLGGTDGNGGVNLRSDDQIDFFIRTEEGFSEEEGIYQLKAQLGGFRTEYTVKVNDTVIGTITRDATDWGVFTESEFGKNLTLKAGDILSICASDSWGTVGDITLTKTEEPAVNPLVYEAEDFYENKDGIQHEGSVQYCDVQPGEAVTFTMMAELPAGYYKVSAVSNGTRMAYMVSVNGTPRGVIKRTATGWNAADLTTDSYDEILWLEPGDTVTLTASANKEESDGQTFGKLDKLVLESASEPAAPAAKDRITLRAENWYGGTKDSSGGMNIRPDDSLDFVIREQDGFVEGDYSITVKSGGFRSGYTVKVNGETVTELSVRTCEWGLYLSSTASVRVHLKPGDILSFYGADSWGCIDAVIFQKDGAPANTSMADRRGGRIAVPYYAKSEGAKASGEAPTFIFQGEGYYKKQTDNPAADLQPGQQIEIPLSDNPNFVDGVYQVTVVSCGGRDHMFVKVNGLKTGRIDRHSGAYGMDKMTQDKLPTTVTLSKGDLLCIEAAPTEWGWVDYIQLDLIQKAETPVERKSYEFKAMNFYGKKQADTDTADLQPGESIEIPVAADGFEAGYYLVSATACGDRTKMSVEVNGEEVGFIQRNKNSYGIEAMVRDTMPVPVYLKPGDQLSICAPANGGWGWVEKVTLIEADGENGIQ